MAGVAVSAQSINPCTELSIVFFGVADQPLRAVDAQAVLEGCAISDNAALTAAQQSLPAELMLGDTGVSADTRLQLARVALKRALLSMAD